MLEKRTVLDRIEIAADGTVFIRLIKQVIDGDAVLASEPHRSAIEPTTAVDDQMAAVNNHLQQMGFPEVSPSEIDRLNSHATLARTSEAVAAYKAAREKAEQAIAITPLSTQEINK